jgi:hypothetical protein
MLSELVVLEDEKAQRSRQVPFISKSEALAIRLTLSNTAACLRVHVKREMAMLPTLQIVRLASVTLPSPSQRKMW